MRIVYKYQVDAEGIISVPLPRGATPLYFGMQGSQLCLWALVDLEQPIAEMFRFRMAGTGHLIEPQHAGRHINTLQHQGFVFHFFHIQEK